MRIILHNTWMLIWKEITISHQLLRNERYTYVGALANTLQRKMSWKLAIHVHNKIKHMKSTYKTIVDFLQSTWEGLKYSINEKMGVTTIHDNTLVHSPLWHRLDPFMFDHVVCNITHDSLVIFQNMLMLKPCSLVFQVKEGWVAQIKS